MPSHSLQNVAETARLIEAGRILLLAGDEDLLSSLPEGTWIGGTSAKFVSSGGHSRPDILFVTDITDVAARAEVRAYDSEGLRELAAHKPVNGFTVLNVPGLSDIHAAFAKGAPEYQGVFDAPLFGWISGVAIGEIGGRAPKVFAGNGEPHAEKAAALHVTGPKGKTVTVDVVDIFRQGEGPDIVFDKESFVSEGVCRIGGEPGNLAYYLLGGGVDAKLPLVADYDGTMISVSIRAIDAAAGRVTFYAPVFPGVRYRVARPVGEGLREFFAQLDAINLDKVAQSCKCILNYLYSDLEGKRTGEIFGPITLGDSPYMLLN